MGYVSHIFMYMDIRKHINLVKNHGYEGKIGMIKKDVHGIDLRMYASNPGCCIIMFFSMSDKVYFPEIT